MVGKTITVQRPSYSYDASKNEITTWKDESVENVLVAPVSAADIQELDRTHGTKARIRLGFPKTYSDSLRGCRIVPGDPFPGTYAVIGDPMPNMVENCPTEWWYTAEAEACDG